MSRPAITVAASARLGSAAVLMEDWSAHAPPADADRLVGIVTDRDLVTHGLARELAPDTRVDVVMTANVLAVDEDGDVAIAYLLLRDHAVRQLPMMGPGGSSA